jgi:hypothetical protein
MSLGGAEHHIAIPAASASTSGLADGDGSNCSSSSSATTTSYQVGPHVGVVGFGPDAYQAKHQESINIFREREQLGLERLGFTDFAPLIFRDLRLRAGVSLEQYNESFALASILAERPSEGKSGQLFYFTPNKRFLVKTVSRHECHALRALLPAYHQHVAKHSSNGGTHHKVGNDTLLVR